MQTTPADRLKQASEQAGYATAADLARAMDGVEASTVRSHMNGTRGIGPEQARRYGKRLGVTPEWLLFGTDVPSTPLKASDPMQDAIEIVAEIRELLEAQGVTLPSDVQARTIRRLFKRLSDSDD